MRLCVVLLGLGLVVGCSRKSETNVLSGVVEARLANIASRVGGRVVAVEAEVDHSAEVERGHAGV